MDKAIPIEFDGAQITPSKIICVGRNYVDHIDELNNKIPDTMVLFAKNNAYVSHTLHSTHQSDELHYEAELCFLYQNKKIAAMAVGLDLTKRTLQNTLKSQGLPWERAKSFSGSAFFSQFIKTTNLSENLNFTLQINSSTVQHGFLTKMIHSPSQIMNEINQFTQLYDGDIIMTGTPKGVGKINQGDLFTLKLFDDKKCLISHKWLVS